MAVNVYQESDWCEIATLLVIIRAGYGEGTGLKAVDSSQNQVGNARRGRKSKGTSFPPWDGSSHLGKSCFPLALIKLWWHDH